MLRYIGFRLLSMIPSLLLISILVFLITALIPGDPTMTLLGMEVTESQRDALRIKLGLDKPVYIRYGIWLVNVLRGDLGQSMFGQFKVTYLIGRALPVSLELMLFTILIALIIAIPAAIISAVKKNSWMDVGVTMLTFAGLSLPAFWLAIMMIYVFAVDMKLLPATGYARISEGWYKNIRSMILPSVTLGILYSTGLMRFLRAALLDVMNEDYIRTARMKGVIEWRVLFRHVLKNAMIPFITILGLEMAWLLGGSVLIENVFALPGMGRLALNAILQRDYSLVQGIVLVMAALFLLINLAVDVLYAFLDPRVRLGGKT
ncbi:MAG: ABC transporter permease [Chloroflexi bacterium]|nr:MAG: ABC transporter permease [Chloroflexota bacterium]